MTVMYIIYITITSREHNGLDLTNTIYDDLGSSRIIEIKNHVLKYNKYYYISHYYSKSYYYKL